MLRAAKPLLRLDAEMWRNFLLEQEYCDGLNSKDLKTAEKPRQKRLSLEDPDGVLCFQDELSRWFGSMEKYGGRGASADRGF